MKRLTMEQARAMMAENGAYLDLRRTDVTELSDNLTLDCFLADMSDMPLTALPDSLRVGGPPILAEGTPLTEKAARRVRAHNETHEEESVDDDR